jgi:eukaryotic-like serine/threonine-protein kinase
MLYNLSIWLASLGHSHVCSLYDIGREDGIDFLVTQYLEGKTLSKGLKREPLATEQVLRYAVEIAGALDEVHRNGVTYRDLEAGNITLTESGAKLLDFRLVK